MWLIIKEALIQALALQPESIIHLAGGYARVKVSPLSAVRLQSARTQINGAACGPTGRSVRA